VNCMCVHQQINMNDKHIIPCMGLGFERMNQYFSISMDLHKRIYEKHANVSYVMSVMYGQLDRWVVNMLRFQRIQRKERVNRARQIISSQKRGKPTNKAVKLQIRVGGRWNHLARYQVFGLRFTSLVAWYHRCCACC
jgi:hypothetical protein